jgi:glycine/D-amino acid oxidase-like deaminating enzyme
MAATFDAIVLGASAMGSPTAHHLAKAGQHTLLLEQFEIDHHPEYPHMVFGGGCSGHSFKFSPIIGEILSDLALNGTTAHDISLFQVSRFPQVH